METLEPLEPLDLQVSLVLMDKSERRVRLVSREPGVKMGKQVRWEILE
jgi:hypothetical protein